MFRNKDKDKQQQPAQEVTQAKPKKGKAVAQVPAQEHKSLDGNYPGLNGLKYGVGYLEQTLNILCEPLLGFCTGVAIIDFMTGGHLMEVSLINYIWAGSFALAAVISFIITWRRSATALGMNRYGTAGLLAFLGILLGIVDGAALATKGLQQMLNIPFGQALTWLYLNPVAMVYIRSAVAMFMLVLVTLSNHVAVTTAVAPKRRLALFDQLVDRLAPKVESDNHAGDNHANQNDKPIAPANPQSDKQPVAKTANLTLLKPAQAGTDEILERVRQALSDNPELSDRALAKAAGTSPITAKRKRAMLAGDNLITTDEHEAVNV